MDTTEIFHKKKKKRKKEKRIIKKKDKHGEKNKHGETWKCRRFHLSSDDFLVGFDR